MLDSELVIHEIMELLGRDGPSFTFSVRGIPASKGSKNARVIQNSRKNASSTSSGRKSGPRAIMYEADKGLPAWKIVVEAQAKRNIPSDWTFGPGDKQIYFLLILLYFPRPDYHFDKDYKLLPRYERVKYKGTKPDADKNVRAIGDVLSGLAYADDAQVVAPWPIKLYCPPGRLPGAVITLKKIVTV